MSEKTIAGVLVLIAFVSGLFVGAAGDRAYLFKQHRLAPSERGSRDFVKHTLDRLDRELNLTQAQRTRIGEILQRRRQQVDTVMAVVRPQVRQTIEATDREIASLLTPEQRPKFASLRARMARRHDREHSPR